MPPMRRALAAFVLAPLLASAGYIYISWAGEMSWFTFLLTAGIAFGITLAVMLPSFLILLRVGGFNAYTSVAMPFLILLAISAIHSAWSYSDFDESFAANSVENIPSYLSANWAKDALISSSFIGYATPVGRMPRPKRRRL